MKKKVYCRDCYHLYEKTGNTEIVFECHHPSNIIYEDSWLYRKEQAVVHPSEKNKFNACKYFANRPRFG